MTTELYTTQDRILWLWQNTIWKAIPDTILRSSVAKIKRNLKMTAFQEMGVESKLLNQIQPKYDTLRSQGTENPPLGCFFLDTRYTGSCL